MIRYLTVLGLMLLCLSGTARAASAECEGNFVNPITDICWECIFPVTIGNVPVVNGSQPDTPILPCRSSFARWAFYTGWGWPLVTGSRWR